MTQGKYFRMSDQQTTRSHGAKKPGLTVVLLLLAIFAAGALTAWWMAVNADSQMRANLLQQAQLVAQAVNVRRILTLTGTEADLDNSDYWRLKEQLFNVRLSSTKFRTLYLILGRRADLSVATGQSAPDLMQTSDAVFFFVDSENIGTKNYSPPGQVYEDISQGYRRVFDSRFAAVKGPVTDHLGVWISALVPLIDPQTGAMVAVFSMNIDARDWKWDVAAQACLPVGLVLVLLVGVTATFLSSYRVDASPKPIMRRMLPPLTVMVILMIASAVALLWQHHRQHVDRQIADEISNISKNLITVIRLQTASMVATLQPIVANTDVQEALAREGYADHLLTTWRPVFEVMRRESHITHFYFLDTNRICILRVHKPELRGDIINRFTALEAERTRKIASGNELGPLGTFTSRVVQPVFKDDRLVGYVELGTEIEASLETIHSRSNVLLAVVIRKQHLDRQGSEEGMRLFGREQDWDRLPRSIVSYTSQGRLPDAFASWADSFADDHVHGDTGLELACDGKDWRVSAIPMLDASGKGVGDLLIMRDVSVDKAAFASMLTLGGTACGVVLSLLMGFIYVLLRRTDAGIYAQQTVLQESETRLRTITDSAQDAILMMDTKGLISYWNPAAERILGYKNTEAIGRNLHALIAPSRYHKAHQAAFPLFQQTGHGPGMGKTFDMKACRKDGAEIFVQISISAVQMIDGWHAVGILRDITNRRQAEAELHETNQQLEAATVRAEMASIAKSEFLANMSHEIRTPMNGVIGMTGLLLNTNLDDEQRCYAEIVRTSGESLLGLINDILDFTKIEAGKLELEMLDFDLSSLLDDFADTLAMRAHEKGLELLCSADLNVPTLLRGDPGRLRQALTNMTGNAIKFTSAGEVTIRVSLVEGDGVGGAKGDREQDTCRVLDSDGLLDSGRVLDSENMGSEGETVLLRFSVRDTGIGIPEDKIGLLFEKFSQVDASTTRRYGGTGLGLAISRQLAELMNGGIGASSEEGKGSEFWFTARLGKQAVGGQAESIPPADLCGVRVLIVEDSAANREILSTRLASWGMRPTEVKDGPEALQALYRALDENDPFRIAVIDMQMPGMDGETLGRAIHTNNRLNDIRMVMMTSLGMRGDAWRFQEIGFAAYTTKPIHHQALKAVLSLMVMERNGTEPQPIVTRHTAREKMNLFAGRKARILLAEDNITNQQVALGILKIMGIYADVVANGVEALKAIETLPYDLVLMDVQMPQMDGLEATRKIRNYELGIMNKAQTDASSSKFEIRNSSFVIPIIAMTAHTMKGDRERCLEAGMNDYIAKPVSPRALAEVLEKWLPKENDDRCTGMMKKKETEKDDSHSLLIFDRAGMITRLMDDEKLARTVVEGFIEDIPLQIEALRGYLETGDAASAERQAHTIKGASANVGGERLRAAALEMEIAGKAGDMNAINACLVELETQFDLLSQAMKKEMRYDQAITRTGILDITSKVVDTFFDETK